MDVMLDNSAVIVASLNASPRSRYGVGRNRSVRGEVESVFNGLNNYIRTYLYVYLCLRFQNFISPCVLLATHRYVACLLNATPVESIIYYLCYVVFT